MTSSSFRVGPIRPPSEAKSLLLQVTNGCTWNKCAFCDIYRHTKFKAYSADSVKEDIDRIAQIAGEVKNYRRADSGLESMRGSWDIDGLNFRLGTIEGEEDRQCFYMVANWLISGGETVFLQDGNTTALASGRLSDVLIYLKQTFPQVRRITSYGRAADLARHDAEYFAELKAAGLDRIHSGFESGSDKVLKDCILTPQELWKCLYALGTQMIALYRKPASGEIFKEFKKRTGIEIGSSESSSTRRIPNMMRQYNIHWNGENINIEPHLKCSDDQRIHFGYSKTKDMLVGDIVNNIEGAAGALMESGMHCLGCPASRGETIEQACEVHGVDPQQLIDKLNAHFGE